MSDICRVALDAMGGDNAPGEVVKGAVEATKKENDIHVVLVGKEAAIQAELDKYDYSKEQIEVVDAADVIETGEPPVMAVRRKKESSLVKAMYLVKEGKARCICLSRKFWCNTCRWSDNCRQNQGR